jgi:membrane carboxypeptidase/penicillin-binding protein PbpC
MGGLAYSLVMFVVVSVLAGVLVAGLFIPLAGMAGVTSKAAAAELESLPAVLATPAPATRSKVLMGNGKTLAYFYDENRIPVKLKNIAPIMRTAQIAIEDHRYYEHGALDFKGTMRALVRNSAAGGTTQGGSSITQQYVKMVQIEACQAKGDTQCVRDAQAPTLQRKIRELRYAIAMEKKFSKDEILERYLNIAYYGQGAYGVEAAARHYYSTKASKLTLPQAAMLAGLVQNPDTNNPVRNPSAALDRRDVVQPDGRTQIDHPRPGQRGETGRLRRESGQEDPERLRRHALSVPLRLRATDAAQHAQLGEDRGRPREHDQPRRADHPDCDRPQNAGPGAAEGQLGGRPERPDHLDHEHDPAWHRTDHRHGAEQAGDG